MKIVAIGGGEIGRPGTNIETESIDKKILNLSGKSHPKLLFIPTASGDSESYYEVVKTYFGSRLGCKTDVLYLIKDKLSPAQIKDKIFNADIIYVGGGNTLKMLRIWRRQGVDQILRDAMQAGVILSGVSAGAICWFDYGNSDSLQFKTKTSTPADPKDTTKQLIKVKGLGFIPVMACPHYDGETTRRPSLKKMVGERGGIAIALENCSAIEVVDGKYRILASSDRANAYLVYRKDGRVVEEKIKKSEKYSSLSDLLSC